MKFSVKANKAKMGSALKGKLPKAPGVGAGSTKPPRAPLKIPRQPTY